MNSQIITHEMALVRLKQLEASQRLCKAARDFNFKFNPSKAPNSQKNIVKNKKEINTLLSIIHWHKMAKKMFYQLNKKE